MIKVSNFTLDEGEAPPICHDCKEIIVAKLAEISTNPSVYYHVECGTSAEERNQKLADDVSDWQEINKAYAASKGE